jgi:hypothetical protein
MEKEKTAHSHWAKWPQCRPSPSRAVPSPALLLPSPAVEHSARARARALAPLSRGRQRVAATAAHKGRAPDPPGSPSPHFTLSSLCSFAAERHRRHGCRLAAATVPRSPPRRVHELRRPRLRRLHRLDRAERLCFTSNAIVFNLRPPASSPSIRRRRALPEPAPAHLQAHCEPPLPPRSLPSPLASRRRRPLRHRTRLRLARRRRAPGDPWAPCGCPSASPQPAGHAQPLRSLACALQHRNRRSPERRRRCGRRRRRFRRPPTQPPPPRDAAPR